MKKKKSWGLHCFFFFLIIFLFGKVTIIHSDTAKYYWTKRLGLMSRHEAPWMADQFVLLSHPDLYSLLIVYIFILLDLKTNLKTSRSQQNLFQFCFILVKFLLKNRTHFNSEISQTVKYYPSGKSQETSCTDHLNAIRKTSRGWSQAIPPPHPPLLPSQISLKNVIWGNNNRVRLNLASSFS